MKKTIATCLLLILILSCVFSFVACKDSVDPIVGKYYRSISNSVYDSAYLIVRSDGTATTYWCKQANTEIGERDDYTSWILDEESNIYFFNGRRGQSNPDKWMLVDGNLQNPEIEQHIFHRISDSEWPDYIPKN
ncbi:MAG: hypothetical protein K2K85_04950 [Clostridia bacterium]|nr:hypothetical protein [Clostridia bacterium]